MSMVFNPQQVTHLLHQLRGELLIVEEELTFAERNHPRMCELCAAFESAADLVDNLEVALGLGDEESGCAKEASSVIPGRKLLERWMAAAGKGN